jgi:GTPase
VLDVVTQRRQQVDPRYLIGKGKIEELITRALQNDATMLVFDHDLNPAQSRTISDATELKVIDRTMLILDIFAQHAQSRDGKLQVELAQLKHLSTRLVRGWTHLERQKGGIGLRGPGETQLESDRRLIGIRVKLLKSRLEQIGRQRETQRRARRRAAVRNIALAGYTNAGKSTLFNRLTGARVYAADQLFATLDTTLRRLSLPDAEDIVLSDTVGFIRDLPHDLVAAFRATLKEAVDADLLLHVVDASQVNRADQIAAVDAVLSEIGADAVPQVLVLNKCDVTALAPGVERDEYGKIRAVRLSALTGAGVPELHAALAERFPRRAREIPCRAATA